MVDITRVKLIILQFFIIVIGKNRWWWHEMRYVSFKSKYKSDWSRNEPRSFAYLHISSKK